MLGLERWSRDVSVGRAVGALSKPDNAVDSLGHVLAVEAVRAGVASPTESTLDVAPATRAAQKEPRPTPETDAHRVAEVLLSRDKTSPSNEYQLRPLTGLINSRITEIAEVLGKPISTVGEAVKTFPSSGNAVDSLGRKRSQGRRGKKTRYER